MSSSKILKLISASAVIALTLVLSACGKEVTLSVKDGKVTSEVTIQTGKTVSEALAEAGVTLNEKDEVTPAADTKIDENLSGIVVGRYAKVTVIDGEETKEVEVTGGTVGDVLKAAGITIGEHDTLLKYSEDDPAEDGMTVEVTHSKVVTIEADGSSREAVTEAKTVKELLEEQGITVGKDDIVEPDTDTELESGAKVTVKRVTYKEETNTEKIPYETKEEYSDAMDAGTSEVTQKGKDGKKETVVKIKYIDGKEEDSEVISEKTTDPVDEIITYGTKEEAPAEEYTAPEEEYYEEIYYEPEPEESGRSIVSQVAYPNCADGSHGYYEIVYSDGSVEYVEY